MNRLWTALLLFATVVVAGAVGYVLVHNDKVPRAGETPGFTPTTSSITDTSGVRGTPTTSTSVPGGGTTGGTSGGPSPSADPSSMTIAFLGDNWANGAGVDHKHDKTFPALLGKALSVHVEVAAEDRSGYAKRGEDDTTFAGLSEQVIDAEPDIVVVSGGRNDISDDINTLKDAAKDLFADLHKQLPDAEIVAVAPFWGDSDHPSDLRDVDEAVKTAVEAAGGTYLDIEDPLHHHSDWMADEANPDERGNQAIADALEPKLKALLA